MSIPLAFTGVDRFLWRLLLYSEKYSVLSKFLLCQLDVVLVCSMILIHTFFVEINFVTLLCQL